MNKFHSNEQSNESDDFDIDLRLSEGQQSRSDQPKPFVSRDSNCSTCSHTTPHLCC